MKKANKNNLKTLLSVKQIVFELNKENYIRSADTIIHNFDDTHYLSFNFYLSQIIYISFIIDMKDFDIYLNFLKEIETFEKNNKFKIFDIFVSFLENEKTQEAYYLLNNMIDQNLIEPKIIIQKLQYPYFVQSRFIREILLTSEELSKNDWELHKQLIHVGINPNEIAKIIRNDELEKLQEISSQENFDFNQVIKPSVYERCNFINQSKVSLIDYAAFFGSVKCFKYLLMNNTNVENTGKYAVAGGNEEIIHLCEQNHSSFKGAYETAIKYHRNDIFKYIYENKIENIKIKINNLPYFGRICIIYHNYDILLYLIDKGMKINDFLINESIKIGNLYLLKYFHKFKQLPKDILLSSVGPKAVKNVEIVEYILNQKGNNINIKDNEGRTALIKASSNGDVEIVKLLCEQKGIDINLKDNKGKTALIYASEKGDTEIVKYLLEQKEIDFNARDDNGETALIFATKNGYKEVAQLLIEKDGIDINVQEKNGKTPLIYSYIKGYSEILLESSFFYATRNGHTEIAQLIQAKCKTNTK